MSTYFCALWRIQRRWANDGILSRIPINQISRSTFVFRFVQDRFPELIRRHDGNFSQPVCTTIAAWFAAHASHSIWQRNSLRHTFIVFTWPRAIVAFSTVAGLAIFAKFDNSAYRHCHLRAKATNLMWPGPPSEEGRKKPRSKPQSSDSFEWLSNKKATISEKPQLGHNKSGHVNTIIVQSPKCQR